MQQTTTKEVHELAPLGGKDNPLEIAQEIKILQYYQIVYTQTRTCPTECNAWSSMGFCNTNRSPNSGK